jgi:hypothetical protein
VSILVRIIKNDLWWNSQTSETGYRRTAECAPTGKHISFFLDPFGDPEALEYFYRPTLHSIRVSTGNFGSSPVDDSRLDACAR